MYESDEFYDLADRQMVFCDAKGCGTVVAKMYVAMPGGGELKFCFHHANAYRARLNDQGAFLYALAEA